MAESKVVISAEDRTAKVFSAIDKNVLGLNKTVGKLAGGLAAAGGVAGIGAMIKGQIDLGDELSKTSQKIGASVEQISAWRYGAKLWKVDSEQLTAGLGKLGENIQTAAIKKTGEAAQWFRALGVSVVDASGKVRETGAVFEEVSARLAKMQDGTQKSAAATKLMGDAGRNLIPLINNLKATTEEAQRVGAVVSTSFAKQSANFNASVSRMQTSLGTLTRRVAMDLVPAFNYWIERLNVAMGAQDRLSLQALEDQLGSLQKRYAQLQEEKKRAIIIGDFSKSGLARETAEVIVQIDKLENLIQVEKNRMESRKKLQEQGSAGAGPLNLPDAAADKERDKTESRLEKLALELASEREQQVAHYEEQLALLNEAESQKIAAITSYDEMRAQLKAQHEQKLTEIEDAELKKRYGLQQVYRKLDLAAASSLLGQLSNLMQGGSKRQFEIGKKAAMAEAAINTYNAAIKAYQSLAGIPVVGPALGAAAAAAAVVFGKAQVDRIKAQQYESGAAGGGAVPTVSVNPNTGEPGGTPGGDVGTTSARGATGAPAANSGPIQVTVMLDSQVLIDTIQNASASGRLTIRAASVR